MTTTRRPPKHLSKELAAIWSEIAPQFEDDTPAVILECIVSHTATLRQARQAIQSDGTIVRNTRQEAVPHPAIDVERQAAKTLSDLAKDWAKQ